MLRRHFDREVWGSATLRSLASGHGTPVDHWIALHPVAARAGARPVACLTVHRGECLAALPDQVAVDVRGWPEIGRAVVVAVNGTEFWPSWPCTTVRSPPKLTAPPE